MMIITPSSTTTTAGGHNDRREDSEETSTECETLGIEVGPTTTFATGAPENANEEIGPDSNDDAERVSRRDTTSSEGLARKTSALSIGSAATGRGSPTRPRSWDDFALLISSDDSELDSEDEREKRRKKRERKELKRLREAEKLRFEEGKEIHSPTLGIPGMVPVSSSFSEPVDTTPTRSEADGQGDVIREQSSGALSSGESGSEEADENRKWVETASMDSTRKKSLTDRLHRRAKRLREKAQRLKRKFFSSLLPYKIRQLPRAVPPFYHDVLGEILLFVEADLPTLAAIRATCRSWNFVCNHLPIWSCYTLRSYSVPDILQLGKTEDDDKSTKATTERKTIENGVEAEEDNEELEEITTLATKASSLRELYSTRLIHRMNKPFRGGLAGVLSGKGSNWELEYGSKKRKKIKIQVMGMNSTNKDEESHGDGKAPPSCHPIHIAPSEEEMQTIASAADSSDDDNDEEDLSSAEEEDQPQASGFHLDVHSRELALGTLNQVDLKAVKLRRSTGVDTDGIVFDRFSQRIKEIAKWQRSNKKRQLGCFWLFRFLSAVLYWGLLISAYLVTEEFGDSRTLRSDGSIGAATFFTCFCITIFGLTMVQLPLNDTFVADSNGPLRGRDIVLSKDRDGHSPKSFWVEYWRHYGLLIWLLIPLLFFATPLALLNARITDHNILANAGTFDLSTFGEESNNTTASPASSCLDLGTLSSYGYLETGPLSDWSVLSEIAPLTSSAAEEEGASSSSANVSIAGTPVPPGDVDFDALERSAEDVTSAPETTVTTDRSLMTLLWPNALFFPLSVGEPIEEGERIPYYVYLYKDLSYPPGKSAQSRNPSCGIPLYELWTDPFSGETRRSIRSDKYRFLIALEVSGNGNTYFSRHQVLSSSSSLSSSTTTRFRNPFYRLRHYGEKYGETYYSQLNSRSTAAPLIKYSFQRDNAALNEKQNSLQEVKDGLVIGIGVLAAIGYLLTFLPRQFQHNYFLLSLGVAFIFLNPLNCIVSGIVCVVNPTPSAFQCDSSAGVGMIVVGIIVGGSWIASWSDD